MISNTGLGHLKRKSLIVNFLSLSSCLFVLSWQRSRSKLSCFVLFLLMIYYSRYFIWLESPKVIFCHKNDYLMAWLDQKWDQKHIVIYTSVFFLLFICGILLKQHHLRLFFPWNPLLSNSFQSSSACWKWVLANIRGREGILPINFKLY